MAVNLGWLSKIYGTGYPIHELYLSYCNAFLEEVGGPVNLGWLSKMYGTGTFYINMRYLVSEKRRLDLST